MLPPNTEDTLGPAATFARPFQVLIDIQQPRVVPIVKDEVEGL